MNKPFLYSSSSKTRTIVAVIFALAIHLSALAFAALKRDPASVGATPIDFSMPPADAEVTLDQPETVQIPHDSVSSTDFLDDSSPPPPPVRKPSSIRGRNISTALRGAAFKALAIIAPRPAYPYEARSRHITGSGIIIVSVDPATGIIVDAEIDQSIGNPILDNAALSAFRCWRFKPGCPTKIKIPITYLLTGAAY